MTAIQCDTEQAEQLLLQQPDAHEVTPNSPYELWRIYLNDAVAVAYRGKVLPQGRNPQRVAEIIRQAGYGAQEILL